MSLQVLFLDIYCFCSFLTKNPTKEYICSGNHMLTKQKKLLMGITKNMKSTKSNPN